MIDTKELRKFAKRVHLFYNNTDIMHNAADELDALRARNAELESQLKLQSEATMINMGYHADHDELTALKQQLAEARELSDATRWFLTHEDDGINPAEVFVVVAAQPDTDERVRMFLAIHTQGSIEKAIEHLAAIEAAKGEKK